MLAAAKQDTAPSPSLEPRDLTKEYVSSHGAIGSRIGQVLSNFADDLEWIVSLDVYERMSRDPVVSKNLQFQKLSVVSEGLQLHPAISDKDNPEFELAAQIKDFHERSLKNLHRPVSQIIGEMMVALKRGHSVAEITYRDPVTTGIDAYKLLLKSIKVKPRNTTAFVIDEFRNVLGLTAWVFGRAASVPGTKIENNYIVPLEKFAVLAFETEDEDPRGIVVLRPAYNFWQAKCLVPGLNLKWLEKCGIPSVVGFTAQDASDVVTEEGTKSPQEVMADSLVSLESGSSAAFPYGAKIETIEIAGNGSQFSRSYQDFDTQIDYALSGQSGATKDSNRGAYSSKRILKDVLDLLAWSRKQAVAQVFQKLLCDGTRYNFGADKIHLTPFVMIGDEESHDWATDATAAGELAPYLTDSQWNSVTKDLGIPPPLPDEQLPKREKAAAPAPNGQQPKDDGENEDAIQPPPVRNQKPGQKERDQERGGEKK